MKILCVICARGGSKGLKNKNILDFFGKPLVKHTLDQAKKIKKISNIVVSTDSIRISKIVGQKYSWFLRSKKLSGHKVPKMNVIIDTLIRSEKKFKINYDVILDLDVTSPLRIIKDINESIKLFKKKKYENLFSVSNASKNPYFNMVEKKKNKIYLSKKKKLIHSRQTAPDVYEMNAAIYLWKKDILLKKQLFGENTGIYIMPKNRSIDIDTKLDYKISKFLYGDNN